MFLPYNRVTFREAATRMAARIAKDRGRKSPSPNEHEFLDEAIEERGRILAGGIIEAFGIISVGWSADEWTPMFEGEEITLPTVVWRRRDTTPATWHWGVPRAIAHKT